MTKLHSDNPAPQYELKITVEKKWSLHIKWMLIASKNVNDTVAFIDSIGVINVPNVYEQFTEKSK